MARATRSTTADLKRKRDDGDSDGDTETPTKLPRVDGQAILAVLETEDTQGLLDRVFPDESSDSLRLLLSRPTPLDVLHRALESIRPISDRPRHLSSPTAAQQLRFCNRARDLIEQSINPSLLNSFSLPDSPNDDFRPQPSYALVQHLPAGDYWSSIINLKGPQHIRTANAELVAILPSSSSSVASSTLSSFSRPPHQKRLPIPQRRITTGTFLDYGPFASFAPSFDQDGELVGRNQLGQVLFHREKKKRVKDADRLQALIDEMEVGSYAQEDKQAGSTNDSPHELPVRDLLHQEDIESIKNALNNLEIEKSVQELLEHNERALQRLQELQFERFRKHPLGIAEEGSEEWDTAHGILDSLILLASLRPRSSLGGPGVVPLHSVLENLQLSLALEPAPGWYGTLPASRSTALRDDSTVKIRPGVPIPTAAPAPVIGALPASGAGHVGYAYPYNAPQAQAYRPKAAAGYNGPYKVGSYYPPSYQQQAYYPSQAYASNQQPYGGGTGQQGYTGYTAGGWYSQYAGSGGRGRTGGIGNTVYY